MDEAREERPTLQARQAADMEHQLGAADNFRQEALVHLGGNTMSIEEEVCRSRAVVVGVVALALHPQPHRIRVRAHNLPNYSLLVLHSTN